MCCFGLRLVRYTLMPVQLYGFFFSIEYFLIYAGFALAFWRGTHMLASGEITAVGEIFTYECSLIAASTIDHRTDSA